MTLTVSHAFLLVLARAQRFLLHCGCNAVAHSLRRSFQFPPPFCFWWVGSLFNPAVPSREGLHGPLLRKDRPPGAGAAVRSFFHVSRRRPLIVVLGGAHPTDSEMNGNQVDVRNRREKSPLTFEFDSIVRCLSPRSTEEFFSALNWVPRPL